MSRKIAIASAIWGFSILASRVIGIVREALIGRILGAGREADLYFTSFIFPDFLNHLLAGGALSIVFIPLFSRHLADQNEEEAWTSFSVIANFLLVALVIVLPALWFVVPFLAPLAGPGYSAGDLNRLVYLTRIMLPAQAFHLLGGLLSAALQAKDRHLLPALAPLVYSLGVILGGLLGGTRFGAEGFAWGVLAGSILGPFVLPFVGAMRHGLRWRPVFRWRHPDLKTYLLRSGPIMVTFSIVVVDDWILKQLGSLLEAGAVAVLNYSKQLMRVAASIFGLAAGIASFPALSRLIAESRREEASLLLLKALRGSLFLAFCSQVVMTCTGPEISRLLYGSRITPEQHDAIGLALGVFCLGLFGWISQALVSRGFYALGRTWPPSLLGTLVLSLSYPLYVYMGQRWSVLGLASASTLAITVYTVLLIYWLDRNFRGLGWRCGMFVLKVIPCIAAGILAGWLCRMYVHLEFSIVRAMVCGGAALAVFWIAAGLTGIPEATELPRRILQRMQRKSS